MAKRMRINLYIKGKRVGIIGGEVSEDRETSEEALDWFMEKCHIVLAKKDNFEFTTRPEKIIAGMVYRIPENE